MFDEIVRENLKKKFMEIQHRMEAAIVQLNDEDLNWRPGSESNSITSLVIHVSRNIHQRVEAGIEGKKDKRDRKAEFSGDLSHTKEELLQVIDQSFSKIIQVVSTLSEEAFLNMQTICNN
jgi:uncharacterized damage-inducible protein DinB